MEKDEPCSSQFCPITPVEVPELTAEEIAELAAGFVAWELSGGADETSEAEE